MKRLLFSILLLSSWFVTQAQPTSGFYFGGNYTFVKDQVSNYTSTAPNGENYTSLNQKLYTPKLGWQLGYNVAIKMNAPIFLSLGANITNKKVHDYEPISSIYFVDEDQETFCLCTPITANYTFGNFFTGLGYEFVYDPGMGSSLGLEEYSHMGLIQLGYQFWFFNVFAKYAYEFRKKDFDSDPLLNYNPQHSVLQLSLVIGSPDFRHREEL